MISLVLYPMVAVLALVILPIVRVFAWIVEDLPEMVRDLFNYYSRV